MLEGFIDIPGFSGKYRINDNGDCVSLVGLTPRVLKRRTIGKSTRNKGWKPYQQYVLYDGNGKQNTKMIHRLVATCFIPNPDSKKEVNHKDNNPTNNHVSNLEWVTPSENAKHASRIHYDKMKDFGKRMVKYRVSGDKNHSAKVTFAIANEIREKYIPIKYSLNKLAKEYRISKKLVLLIIQNKSWSK